MFRLLKTGIVSGVLSCLLCVIFFIVQDTLNINPLGASKAFGYFIMLSMFFLAAWYFRNKKLNGRLYFLQALKLGIITNFCSCLLFSLFIGFYLTKVKPSVLSKHKTESKMFVSSMKEDYIKSIGQEAFEEGLKMIDQLSVLQIMLDEFYKRFFILLIFVVTAAVIMRRTEIVLNR